ncbi:MAG: hypothetical protein U5K84_05505 [Alkalibacterium sp.]|nr:hypothetical protein [Alkalibacterium sp.]
MNNKSEQGFILMESLVSLSILGLFVGTVFPFGMDLLVMREQAKADAELSRFLYESAMFYDKDDLMDRSFSSGGVTASSVESRESIVIYQNDEAVRNINFLYADW